MRCLVHGSLRHRGQPGYLQGRLRILRLSKEFGQMMNTFSLRQFTPIHRAWGRQFVVPFLKERKGVHRSSRAPARKGAVPEFPAEAGDLYEQLHATSGGSKDERVEGQVVPLRV